MTRLKRFDAADLNGDRWGLVGANVWTGRGDVARAISFEGGRVLACGSGEEVSARSPGVDLFDGDGVWVCPGFVDPHIHVRASASARAATDVSGLQSAEAVIAAVDSACRLGGRADAPWISFTGLQDLASHRSRRPDRTELDGVSGGARVRIRDRSGHGWLFNSSGLEAVGVDATAEALPEGVVVERGADGAPTGFVADHVGWVGRRLGRISNASSLGDGVREWSRELAAAGVVALCDTTATNDRHAIESLWEWNRDGSLRQDFTFMSAPGNDAVPHDERHAGVKFADARDSRLPAALAAAPEGEVVAVHCVDPSETAAAISAARACGAGGSRLRIEHASFVPGEWVQEVAELGATVVTHPSFINVHGDRYLDDPDLQPADWLYRLRSWVDAGVPLAFASDAPFGPAEPLQALRAAAERRSQGGHLIGSGEALHGEAALQAVTASAARCSGLDRFGYGRLEEGGPAAAVLLTEDPRDPAALERIELLATIIGGRVAG